MADANSTKRCCLCGEVKPHSDFHKDASAKSGLQSRCRECGKKVKRTYYLKNRDKALQYAKDWAKANPEKAKEKERVRAKRHPGRTTKYARAFEQRNAEKTRQRKAEWKKKNPEKVREAARKAYAAEPHKQLAKYHRRRAQKLASGGTYTQEEVENLFALQKGRCAACREPLERFHADHVVPLARGGSNDILNIQLLCPTCNCRKCAKDPIDFMQEQGFLL